MQVAFAAGITWGIEAADRAFPPPLEKASVYSREVVDANGRLLRAFTTPDGKWRLKVDGALVDPQYKRMLIAYEDRRFAEHRGIDLLALGRAAYQFTTNLRILSGGSTLSMQVARLLEPRQDRSIGSKLLQMARAAQIERRLSKDEILDLYLNLAPYGGNLEGVRAASLAYFGKEPTKLTVAQSALLVALPQLPERRRPDRYHKAATEARARVLNRMAVSAVIGEGEVERAGLVAVPNKRLALPSYAAHLAQMAVSRDKQKQIHPTTLRRDVQAALEAVASQSARKLGPKISVAIVMADASTGEIIGATGSADYFDSSRAGFIDMTRSLRSPGSTLKPFIYGLGFEEGMIAQQTIIEDRPADFYGYRPRNFDMSYQGDVTIRQALQMSLNVPAVKLLESVGPSRLMVRFRRAAVKPVLPANETPGLAIALGGVGITLKDLVQLYAALANGGAPVKLGDGVHEQPEAIAGEPLLTPAAAWQVNDILSGMRPPQGAVDRNIAYKTGTSYGYRDAWSVGYDGRHVIGVWVGRADNAAVPGISGYQSAAPILFEAFVKSGVAIESMPAAPPGALRLTEAELPASLKRFAMTRTGLISFSAREPAPQIVYPPEGAEVELGLNSGETLPLALKLQGGRPPFRWLANGKAMPDAIRKRNFQWIPDGAGYSTLTVIDAIGRAATVKVYLK
ncbi:penicillin-binding protein 1C [Rhizobium alvei]|uniref:peptidoglycan glycosyltransferase n=2 Tax=Rhizobium alvei TaxID=1132659 RepID=A0ABT8YL50_9HYPH|nr:penicillin-binding protein 1C [Rhizobium alvei]MDO6964367.1 penicillin-binding protein 1C [Rhizobium alvei]